LIFVDYNNIITTITSYVNKNRNGNLICNKTETSIEFE